MSEPSKQKLFPRDGAIRISLPVGTQTKFLIPMESLGFLETYGADKTFQIKAPENIDPQRTRRDVPSVWHTADEAGYSNEIVAQIFIQCIEALSEVQLRQGDINRIKVALHSCKTEARGCEKAFQRICEQYNKIVAEINRTRGITAQGGVIGDFPQISNLDDDVASFLNGAKRAVQHIAEVLNEFYGTSVRNARFDQGIAQLKILDPVPTFIVDTLTSQQPDLVRLLQLRNGLDHTPKRTVVQNFHLTVDHLQLPKWSSDGEQAVPLLPEMIKIIGTIIDLAEAVFFVGIQDAVQPSAGPFQYTVVEVPPEARDGTKIRYRFILQFPNGGLPPTTDVPSP